MSAEEIVRKGEATAGQASESAPQLRKDETLSPKFHIPVTQADNCCWCKETFQSGQRRFVLLDFSDDWRARKCIRAICKPCFTQNKQQRRALCDERGRIWCAKPIFGGPGRWVEDESGAWLERIDCDCAGCGEPINIPDPRHTYTGAWRIFRWGVCSDRCYQRSRRKRIRETGRCVDWKPTQREHICIACHKHFVARSDAKFCSSKCRQWHYRRRHA
jgi:hypothetical protein